MNMTRRKFFTGMAIGLPAALVASKLPEPASPPAVTWRSLYPHHYSTVADGRVEPSFDSNWWDTKEGIEVMTETNEILADLKWREV